MGPREDIDASSDNSPKSIQTYILVFSSASATSRRLKTLNRRACRGFAARPMLVSSADPSTGVIFIVRFAEIHIAVRSSSKTLRLTPSSRADPNGPDSPIEGRAIAFQRILDHIVQVEAGL